MCCSALICAGDDIFDAERVTALLSQSTHPLTFSNSEVTGSVFITKAADSLIVRISYSADEKLTTHKPWIWDKDRQSYGVGHDQEDVVKLFLFEDSTVVRFVDVWVWRAGRTAEVGYADDLFWLGNDESSFAITRDNIKPDAGKSCWFSQFQSTFAGDAVKRFYNRPASGSMADVRTESYWNDSVWNIVMSRKLNTGNADDLTIESGKRYGLIVSVRDQVLEEFVSSAKITFEQAGVGE